MTKEEKIDKILDELLEDFIKVNLPMMEKMTLFAKVQNAVHYIENLYAEPCEDAIGRSDMLDAIGHGTTYTSEELQKIIKALPPVNPTSNVSIQITEREKYGRFN